jgi:hypothetical protein
MTIFSLTDSKPHVSLLGAWDEWRVSEELPNEQK